MSDTLHILISHTETWACNCALYLLLYPTLPLFLKWQSCINPVEELYVPARCSYDEYYHDCTGVLPCFGVTSLVHSKFQQSMNSVASFSNCMFVKKKRGGTLAIFMYYWMTLGIFIHYGLIASGQCFFGHCYMCIHALLDFEDVTLDCDKNGRW